MMQVQDLPPVCLIEWLLENIAERTVLDIIPKEEQDELQGQDEHNVSAVILDNGFMLPVDRVIRMRLPGEMELTLEKIADWHVSDLLPRPGEDVIVIELLPPWVTRNRAAPISRRNSGILLFLNIDILLYLLFDQEIRKVEP